MTRPKVSVEPAVEPVGLTEMRDYLRIDVTDEDALLQGLIRGARRHLEEQYDRAFITQTLQLRLDNFQQAGPEPRGFWGAGWYWGWPFMRSIIELRPPVQSVTTVSYLDAAGGTQTFTDFTLDSISEPGRIYPALNKTWPVAAFEPGAVTITFVAGYTRPELVPDDMKAALRLLVGAMYRNREDEVMDVRAVAAQLKRGLDALMAPYAQVLLR